MIECANSKQCSHHKDHYDTCVERVTQQAEASGKPKEDCVEECMSQRLSFYLFHPLSHSLSYYLMFDGFSDHVRVVFELAHCATQCAAPKLFQQLR